MKGINPMQTLRTVSTATRPFQSRFHTHTHPHDYLHRHLYRSYHTAGPRLRASGHRPLTIGIRREDPSRIWERRAPLTPDDVHALLSHSRSKQLQYPELEVHVQPCERRIFRDAEYVAAGAIIRPDLRDAHVVLGIKEPPLSEVWVDAIPKPSTTSPISQSNGKDLVARTYVMFSHTAKGQEYNMPLLSKFLADNAEDGSLLPTLVDYELLTDSNTGKRTVGFGWFAGVAGVLETLSSLAHHHLSLGVASPFLYTPRPHTMPSLSSLREALRRVGETITEQGTPRALGPFVVGVTGTGNVAQGCLSMLKELPIVNVSVEDLPKLVRNPDTDLRKVYLVHTKPTDYLVLKSSSSSFSPEEPFTPSYNRSEYYAHPDQYKSIFSTRVAPYLTVLLNGAGWAPGFPRLMSNENLAEALTLAKEVGIGRFGDVGDISCDPMGGLEFLTHTTTLSEPYYRVNVAKLLGSESLSTATAPAALKNLDDLPDVQMQAVDILPASIPLDASRHFSEKMRGYLGALINRYSVTKTDVTSKQDNEEFEMALQRATIAQGGKLVEKHTWLGDRVDSWRALARPPTLRQSRTLTTPSAASRASARAPPSASKPVSTPARSSSFTSTPSASRSYSTSATKRILLLGSGMVAGPAVQKIAGRSDVRLVVASNSQSELDTLRANGGSAENIVFKKIDVGDAAVVRDLVRETGQGGVVISLLPVSLHPLVAELCIEGGRHLVTASYISEGMKVLHERARSADVLLLNEIGLDPGIDHVSAISLIQKLEAEGKKVESFVSFCGGLVAPELFSASTTSSAKDDSGFSSAGPLGYKFSWSPRGVLTAALNSARYKLRGDIYRVPEGGKLLERATYWRDVELGGMDGLEPLGGMLEGLPNRDSIPYADTYGLGAGKGVDGMRTVLRGTLRYKGFSDLMAFFVSLGLLELGGTILLRDSWADLVTESGKLRRELHPASERSAVDVDDISSHHDPNMRALAWLLSAHTGTPTGSGQWNGLPSLPTKPMTPLDLFTLLLAHKLRYAPGERDMVVMAHEVTARPVSSTSISPLAEEIHTSTLLVYGSTKPSGHSAMARTVGLPVAIAALAIVDGKVERDLRGAHGPGHISVREAILAGLESEGVGMREGLRIGARSSGRAERNSTRKSLERLLSV